MNGLNDYLKSAAHTKRFAFAIIAFVMFTLSAEAQLVNVPVMGFNNDIVANGGGASSTPNTGVSFPAIGFDGVGYSLVTQGYTAGALTPTCFMPTTNLTTSLLTPGLTYTLQAYGTSAVNNNNALTITSPSSTYTSPFPSTNSLTLTTPASYAKLYFLVGSVVNNISNTMNVTVTFTDATTQSFTGANFPNWFSGSAATTAFYQFNRVNPNNTGILNVCTAGNYTGQPSMYEYSVSISNANLGKLVSSITFTNTGTSAAGTTSDKVNYIHIMSVGGNTPCVIPADQPTALSLSSPSGTLINGTFTAAASAPSGYLSVVYPAGAIPVDPSAGTTYSVGNAIGTGKVCGVGAATSLSATGLYPGITYDIYVYAYNTGACATTYNTTSPLTGSLTTSGIGASLLISPYGDGGFENGSTLASNGWTAVTAPVNNWTVGTVPTGFTNQSAYISNNGGAAWAYTNTSITASHIYKDITFPAGQTEINLTLNWKALGEASSWDALIIYTCPTSVTPTNNSPTSTGNAATWSGGSGTPLGSQLWNQGTNLQTFSICLPASFAGTTQRIVLTWKNDGTAGVSPPAAVDNIALVSSTPQAPVNQATTLILTPFSTSQINGSFTAAVPAPIGYLVVRYPAGSAITNPVTGTNYSVGNSLGLGTVISVGASTTFSATGLLGGTAYDFYVYDYTTSPCAGTVYNLVAPLAGTQSTNPCGALTGIIPVGATAPASPAGFTNLTAALTYINTNGLGGHTILELQTDYTTAGESLPFTFSANPCINASKTLTIRPASGVVVPFVFSNSNTTATFLFDGGSFITIDGRPGGVGTGKMISVINTSSTAGSSGNAILLRNEASNNTITFLDLQATNQNAASNIASFAVGAIPGVIAIGTTTGANGNDNNTISFCDIHALINVNVGIFAFNGTAAGNAANNDNCIINGNKIYDWFHATAASAGIDISLGNNNWTVTNNSIYQPSVRTYTGTQIVRGMWITPNTSTLTAGSGYIISNNFIGGNNSSGTGFYTINGVSNYQFYGMDLSLGVGTASSVQGNTITNMDITGGFTGNNIFFINIANGNVNVGTITQNIIGSTTQKGSINFTTSVTNGSMIAFRSGPANGNINFSNNIVSGIRLFGNNALIAPGFNGIAASGGTNITINNNTIGSATLDSSINIVSTSATTTTGTAVRGIICNSASVGASNTITNNTVANINTNYSAPGAFANTLVGISVTSGTSVITGNTIFNLSSNSQTTPGGGTAAVLGIAYSSTAANVTISGNTIHSLKLTHPTNLAITGNQAIFFSGPTTGTNIIEKNFIHSLSAASPANTLVYLTGMDIAAGLVTIRNNMIRLGINESAGNVTSPVGIRGITCNTGTENIYFNSIYIGGSGVGVSTGNTFCYQKTGAAIVDVRNNIFQNDRSNATTGGKHYAVNLNTNTSVTMNNNDYYGTGIGYVFGAIGVVDFASYSPSWIPGDVNSQVGNPQFINPIGGLGAVNLHIHPTNQTVIEQNGVNIATVTDDFDGQIRAAFTPDDIGADAGNFAGFFCSGGPAGPVTSVTNNAAASCGIGSRILTLSGFSPMPGFTYQWQESLTNLPGSFTNVTGGTGGTTSSFTTPSVSVTTYYQCVISCIYGGSPVTSSSIALTILPAPLSVTPASGINVCSGANVDLTATGADSYSWSCNPGPAGYPQVSLFIAANNTATVTTRPTSTLATNPGVPLTTVATPVWTYTVTGTYLNGCTRQATVILNVISTPVIPPVLTYTNSPDPVCAPGTPVTMNVNNSGTVGAGQWTYNWYNAAGVTLLQSTTNTLSTDAYTAPTPIVNGNNTYMVKVSNSLCPSSYGVALPSYFIGYTSQNVSTNANCGDNGTLKIYPEGQNSYTNWYSNTFATGLLGPAFDAIFGNSTSTGGVCTITNGAANQNGAFLVKNPAAINTNNLQVDFKLTTALRGFAFNVLGADGICWSYAQDVTQGLVTTGGLAEGGSGSGIKLAFDATANTSVNFPGIYLMYNCNVPGPGPASPGVIAFKQGSFWQGLTNAPVSITITENGLVTVKFNNEVIFDHIPLPAAYLAADKSTWLHAFTARSGGAGEQHAIDDLTIRYNSYEYSNNSTTGLDGTWQSSNSYSGLAAATYPVWVRNPSNPSCFANTGTVVIGTSPSPSSALTVASPGYNTIVCAGNGTSLTTDVSIPGAAFFWESSANIGGPYAPATGANNDAIYATGPLTSNTYFRCTFTCPSSSPITSTPALVSVNIGSILNTNSPQTMNCGGSPITLTATPGPNTICVWYNVPNGGVSLATGNTYGATPASLPATYYVEPVTTVFTDHYDFGGEKTIGNLLGSQASGVGISTKFTAAASIRIDSIKVFPGAAGTLTVALQNAGSASNLQTFSMAIAAGDVSKFINVPVNFSTTGAGSYQITTSGVNCQYYSSYTGSYAVPYMSMGGVMSIIGGSTTPTGANSTGMYGTAFNWSITASCPVGFGARVPVNVVANPAFLVSATPAVTTGICANAIQSITASSPNAYSVYTWSPIANLYADAGATIPLTAGNNQATVYFKAATAATFNYTVSTAGSGCTNSAAATVTTIAAPNVVSTATPNTVCAGGDIQLSANVPVVSYCQPSYSTGTSLGDYCTLVSVSGTTLSNTTGASGSPYYTLYPASGSTTATLVAGSTYTITLKAGTFSSNDFAVWIDYNQNALFTDPSEKLGEVDNIPASPSSTIITFTVPVTAFNGATRFRVREADQGTTGGMDPCAGYSYGETEDYSLTIVGGLPAPAGSFTYDWSANPNYLNATNISNPLAQSIQTNEVYSVTVTDPGTGCSKTNTINVTALPLPVPSAFSNSPVCENMDLSLFAFDGASYLWTGPNGFSQTTFSGTATINGAQTTNSGLYTVEVTGANGCTATESVSVDVTTNPVPVLVSSSVVSCDGFSDGSFQVGVVGGTPLFTFDVPGLGFNNFGFFGSVPDGVYDVNITDGNGCVNPDPFQVTITTIPNAPPVISCPPSATLNNDPGFCGAMYSYTPPVGTDVCPIIGTVQTAGLGSSGSTNVRFPVGNTVNTFTVTDVLNVSTSCSFSVAVADVQNPIITNCPSNFSSCNPISWTPPSVTDNCLGVQMTASVLPNTNFGPGSTVVTYTATDAYNNTSVCQFTVTRLEESVAPTSMTSNRDYNNICSGESITLTINGGTLGDGGTWKWFTGTCGGTPLPAFNGMTSITVSPSATTTYFARAEGTCNPGGTACVSATVTVSNGGPGNVTITSVPAVGAPGATGVVTCTLVPGATFYRWTSILGHINAIWFNGSPGPVETTTNSVNISFQLPQSNYQIRVVAGNACGRSNNASAHIRGSIEAPACLNGPTQACPGQSNVAYSVASCPSPGANGYQWTVTATPAGTAVIATGQGTSTITVNYLAGFSSATVCVAGLSQFNLPGPTTCVSVSTTAAAPGPISGDPLPCQGTNSQYTITAVPNASSYIWSTNVPGATANGTGLIGTISFPNTTFSGLVQVQAVTSCGTSAATSFSVASGAPGIPGPIFGPASGICGASNVGYSLGTNDANTYNWILPAGVTLHPLTPGNLNAVSLDFSGSLSGPVTITVEAFYNCGSSTSNIVVSGVPGTPTITPNVICPGDDELYFASAPGADSFTWTISGQDYAECSNPNCSQYYVIWSPSGGTLSVTATNGCGTSAPGYVTGTCRVSSPEMETKVYPNPTNGKLTVVYGSYAGGKYTISVTDMTGRTVLTNEVTAQSGMNVFDMDLGFATAGMYMVYVKDTDGKISAIKVTVE